MDNLDRHNYSMKKVAREVQTLCQLARKKIPLFVRLLDIIIPQDSYQGDSSPNTDISSLKPRGPCRKQTFLTKKFSDSTTIDSPSQVDQAKPLSELFLVFEYVR